MNRYIMIIMVALFCAGCSKETGTCGHGKTYSPKTVYINVNGMAPTHTRNPEPTQIGQAATLYSAIIYLLDNEPDPNILAVKTVGTAANDTATPSELIAGLNLGEVPDNVSQVYVVGNWNSSDADGSYAQFPVTAGEKLSAITSTVLNINQVAYWAIDGVETVPPRLVTVMDGQSALVDYTSAPGGWTGDTGPNDGDVYASVNLTPVVARLEFKSFEVAVNSDRYTLYGSFINNFYPDLPLSLETEGYPMVRNGSDVIKYNTDSPSYAYTGYEVMAWVTKEQIVAPANQDVIFQAPGQPDGRYVFHLFGNSPVPQVVFKFTDITYRDNATAVEGYNTIRGFRDQNGNEVTFFERNRVYWFDQYQINGLTDIPDPDLQGDIWVNVRVEQWMNSVVTVDPD